MVLDDTLAFGAYFYNTRCLRRTLYCLISEHYEGKRFWRAEDTAAPVNLMKMLCSVRDAVVRTGRHHWMQRDHVADRIVFS